MCYAIPGQLIEIRENGGGVVDYFGEKRNILLDLSDAAVGDYVYAQGGILVRKISTEEALEILSLWKDKFFELKKMDERLSHFSESDLPANTLQILQKVNLKKPLSRQDMLALLKLEDPRELKVLYELANHIRHREHDNASCIHGIIEFSNHCRENCHYCGIRSDRVVKRYRMSVDEIIEVAQHAVDEYGFKALVLQSGEDPWYDEKKLVKIVSTLRAMGILVFLSIGMRDKELYQKLYQAGARAALLRFETSNEDIFRQLRPGASLHERLTLIKQLKSMGYIIATGFIAGLPDETPEDIVNNILLTQSLGPDMYSFGPLIPANDTPLAAQSKLSIDAMLKIIALTRFVDPDSNILVTTALETFDASAKKIALLAGANSMMINVTPMEYRVFYQIYDNRADRNQTVKVGIQSALDLLYSLGRAPTDIGVVEATLTS